MGLRFLLERDGGLYGRRTDGVKPDGSYGSGKPETCRAHQKPKAAARPPSVDFDGVAASQTRSASGSQVASPGNSSTMAIPIICSPMNCTMPEYMSCNDHCGTTPFRK